MDILHNSHFSMYSYCSQGFFKEPKENSFNVASLMLGQGLTESTEAVSSLVEEFYPGLWIDAAFSTGASQAHTERMLGV